MSTHPWPSAPGNNVQNPQKETFEGFEGGPAEHISNATSEGKSTKALGAERTAPVQRGRPFQPGQSGNPAGRPKGSRNKLSETFLAAMAEDFAEHGTNAIARVRQQDPVAYLRMVSALVPRELILQHEQQPDVDYAELSKEELNELLKAESRKRLVEIGLETVRKHPELLESG